MMNDKFKEHWNYIEQMTLDELASFVDTMGSAMLESKASEEVECRIFSEQLFLECHALVNQLEAKLKYLSLIKTREVAGNL